MEQLMCFEEGIFKEELKNRFLCLVDIKGKETLCYIPSSCRLENFISLRGKKVLLCKNTGKNIRTQYSVYAVNHKKNYIILKPAIANMVVGTALKNKRFSFVGSRKTIKKEIMVNGYKTDFYLPEEKIIVEVKSIISICSDAVFPTVYSDRAINQLKRIEVLLSNGYNVFYFFVSLNPYVKSVSISSDNLQSEYRNIFKKCIDKGMKCKAYAAELSDNQPRIKCEIPLEIN